MLLNNPEIRSYADRHSGPANAALQRAGLLRPAPHIQFPPGSTEYTLPAMAGDAVGDALDGQHYLRPLGKYLASFSSSPARAALLTALGAGVAGAGFGAVTGRDPVTSGVVGAGLGAAGGYGLSALIADAARRRERPTQLMKQSFYLENGQDPLTYVQSKLFADNAMAPQQKTMLIMAVQNLPKNQLFSLADALRSAAGAAVGYIVGHFLLNMGGVGSAMMAGAGGLVGASMGRGRTGYDAIGMPVNSQQDMFGNPRFV